MYFYKHLRVGPSIWFPDEVKQKLVTGEGQFSIYVIALSPSTPGPGANQLEILHSANLQSSYYKKYPPYIIGIAWGRTEAIEIVRDLVQEAYEHTGSGDVRAYLFPNGIRVRRARRQPAVPDKGAADGQAAQPRERSGEGTPDKGGGNDDSP